MPPVPARSLRLGALPALLLAVAAATSAAQEANVPRDAEPPPLLLDPVTVTATRLPELLADVPAAISVVEQEEIQEARPTVNLDESLDRVPGVFVQNSGNFAQDVRVQIRGFGTRAGFGTREIKVLVDGLPLTLPDGQTQFDDVDPAAMARIEVVRGPASALYGNASGGVIQFFTEDGPSTPGAEVRLLGGSFGLGKYLVEGGGPAGPIQLFVQGSFLQLDGYREQSATRSGIVNTKLRWNIDPRTTLTVLFNGVDAPVADDPGALTRAQADTNPRQARPLNVAMDAGESVLQGRLGAVIDRRVPLGHLSAYAYGIYRDFENRLPIPPTTPAVQGGIVTFYRFSPGGGVRYLVPVTLAGREHRLAAGLDVQYQDDDRRRFSNEFGQRGALGLRQDETVTSVGPYVQAIATPLDDVEVMAGLRYDNVRFAVDVAVPPQSGDSGARTFEHWSPGCGVRYSPRPWLAAFFNIGTAFQVPTTTELANPSGPGFNPDVEPQTALNYEIGLRYDQPQSVANAVAFWTNIDGELVPYEVPSQPERDFFRNAGRSRRYGLELDWQTYLLSGLRWSGAVTLMQAEYEQYTTPQGNFDGKAEPGIPDVLVYQELFYRHPIGAYAGFEIFAVDSYPVNDANTASAPGYIRLTLRGGYEAQIGRWRLGPFVGFDNLLDQNYDGTVRVNATGGRYFEPAPGFNVYGGLTVSAAL